MGWIMELRMILSLLRSTSSWEKQALGSILLSSASRWRTLSDLVERASIIRVIYDLKYIACCANLVGTEISSASDF